tara:strand:+ start:2120 stop:5278 length:3159 start_codon:yes stop_codon:yes gene_type:complete
MGIPAGIDSAMSNFKTVYGATLSRRKQDESDERARLEEERAAAREGRAVSTHKFNQSRQSSVTAQDENAVTLGKQRVDLGAKAASDIVDTENTIEINDELTIDSFKPTANVVFAGPAVVAAQKRANALIAESRQDPSNAALRSTAANAVLTYQRGLQSAVLKTSAKEVLKMVQGVEPGDIPPDIQEAIDAMQDGSQPAPSGDDSTVRMQNGDRAPGGDQPVLKASHIKKVEDWFKATTRAQNDIGMRSGYDTGADNLVNALDNSFNVQDQGPLEINALHTGAVKAIKELQEALNPMSGSTEGQLTQMFKSAEAAVGLAIQEKDNVSLREAGENQQQLKKEMFFAQRDMELLFGIRAVTAKLGLGDWKTRSNLLRMGEDLSKVTDVGDGTTWMSGWRQLNPKNNGDDYDVIENRLTDKESGIYPRIEHFMVKNPEFRYRPMFDSLLEMETRGRDSMEVSRALMGTENKAGRLSVQADVALAVQHQMRNGLLGESHMLGSPMMKRLMGLKGGGVIVGGADGAGYTGDAKPYHGVSSSIGGPAALRGGVSSVESMRGQDSRTGDLGLYPLEINDSFFDAVGGHESARAEGKKGLELQNILKEVGGDTWQQLIAGRPNLAIMLIGALRPSLEMEMTDEHIDSVSRVANGMPPAPKSVPSGASAPAAPVAPAPPQNIGAAGGPLAPINFDDPNWQDEALAGSTPTGAGANEFERRRQERLAAEAEGMAAEPVEAVDPNLPPSNDPRAAVAPEMLRLDGTPKGANGFLGQITNNVTGEVMTELTIGGDPNHPDEPLIPLLVPTLTVDEIQFLQDMDPSDDASEIPEGIIEKAREHAQMRTEQGLSVFADEEEPEGGVLPEEELPMEIERLGGLYADSPEGVGSSDMMRDIADEGAEREMPFGGGAGEEVPEEIRGMYQSGRDGGEGRRKGAQSEVSGRNRAKDRQRVEDKAFVESQMHIARKAIESVAFARKHYKGDRPLMTATRQLERLMRAGLLPGSGDNVPQADKDVLRQAWLRLIQGDEARLKELLSRIGSFDRESIKRRKKEYADHARSKGGK